MVESIGFYHPLRLIESNLSELFQFNIYGIFCGYFFPYHLINNLIPVCYDSILYFRLSYSSLEKYFWQKLL